MPEASRWLPAYSRSWETYHDPSQVEKVHRWVSVTVMVYQCSLESDPVTKSPVTVLPQVISPLVSPGGAVAPGVAASVGAEVVGGGIVAGDGDDGAAVGGDVGEEVVGGDPQGGGLAPALEGAMHPPGRLLQG